MAAGCRSSILWLLGVYSVLSAIAIDRVVLRHPLGIAPPPGAVLVIMVPAILMIGRLSGYRPPTLPNISILFVGLIVFFATFDRVLHTELKNRHTGIAPYGAANRLWSGSMDRDFFLAYEGDESYEARQVSFEVGNGFCSTQMASWKRKMPMENRLETQLFPHSSRRSRSWEPRSLSLSY